VRRFGEPPAAFVQRISEEKARAVERAATDLVLAADTVVCVDDNVLGKPKNDDDARRMLQMLSGRDHWVYTGIFLLSDQHAVKDLAITRVTFERLTADEIEEYTRSGEPRDKAGAYAIQGVASKFVSSIQGCYHNVVGLPVSLVYRHLKNL